MLRDAERVGLLVISPIGFLAFAGLSEADRAAFDAFARRMDIVGLTTDARPLIHTIIELRQQHRLKLPDAIIVATAFCERASLATADQQVQATAAVPVVRF